MIIQNLNLKSWNIVISPPLEGEQHYIDLLKPEYNILKKAGSSLGFKHSEETLKKLSAAQKAIDRLGKNHPMFGKKHTEESLAKISDAKKGEKHPMFGRKNVNHPRYGKAKPEGSGRYSSRIAVLDVLTNERTEYDSIRATSLALNIKQPRISTPPGLKSKKNLIKEDMFFKKYRSRRV